MLKLSPAQMQALAADTEDGNPAAPCTAGDLRLKEIVEVVSHNGSETNRIPAAREQYVNLDEQVDPGAPHPEYGRVLRLRARVEGTTGEPGRSLAGQTLYWYVRAGSGNQANLDPASAACFDAPGSGILRKETVTDRGGWTPVVRFHLSQYGGDQFDVFVTDDPSYQGGISVGTFTVWRKLWYQVTEMRDAGEGILDLPASVQSAFEAGYASVFIRFEETGPRKRADHVGVLEDQAARAAHAARYFDVDQRSPFKAHLMTIDYSGFDISETTAEDTMRELTWTSPDFEPLWMHGAAPHPWKVSAEYQPRGGEWTPIPDVNLTTEPDPDRAGYRKIKVDFSSLPREDRPRRPIDIKITYRFVGPRVWYGWGGGSHHIYLCTGALRDRKTRADWNPYQQSDLVHEMGHALGLVNKPPAAPGAHDAWEDPNEPRHCIMQPTECAMHARSSTARLTTFHLAGDGTGCHDHLRRQCYDRSVMTDRWGVPPADQRGA